MTLENFNLTKGRVLTGIILLFLLFTLPLILIQLQRRQEIQREATAKPSAVSMLFGMFNPPAGKICDYPVVAYGRKALLDSNNNFRPTILQTAKSCGTKVILRLHGLTNDILNDNGVGLSLEKYEDRINDFAGLIDPYVKDGTIIAHFTIDEPHDCHDWGGSCPQPSEVDQASQISKKYWPDLLTLVNTIPGYASKYQWEQTDIINFQYAYHKGPLNQFVEQALEVLNNGQIDNISWTIMAKSGGCPNYGQCPMSPKQVVEVGTTMCNTRQGVFIGFVGYNEKLLDNDMLQAIDQVRSYCRDVASSPSPIPTPTPTPPSTGTPTPSPSPTPTPPLIVGVLAAIKKLILKIFLSAARFILRICEGLFLHE